MTVDIPLTGTRVLRVSLHEGEARRVVVAVGTPDAAGVRASSAAAIPLDAIPDLVTALRRVYRQATRTVPTARPPCSKNLDRIFTR